MSLFEKVREAVESRTGLLGALGRAVNVHLPGGAKWRYVFGAMLLGLVLVEALTGVAIMTVYSPGTHTAWASTYYIQYVLPWGAMVRGMHHWASHGLVVLIIAHMLQVVSSGAHRAPREVNWWLGMGLAAMVLGFAMTGFPLSWEQRGYWASRVETGIIGTMPVMGPMAQRLALGGTTYGALTLTRFYTLHVIVLPALFAALMGAHLGLVRKHGLKGSTPSSDTTEDRWWPSQAARDAVAAFAMVALVAWVARTKGLHMDAPADAQSRYPARPEWYFSPLSQLLHHFQGPMQIVGTAVIPGALGGYLAALPFVDGPSRKGVARIAGLLPLALFGMGAVFLGWEMKHHDSNDRDFRKATWEAHVQARRSVELAARGVPPEGPLEMMHNDPDVRPRALFAQQCGSCHAVQGVSTQRKGPTLDGFGSRAWAQAFIVWPDHPQLMGTTEIHDMPAQRRYNDDQLRALSEWLYSQGVERGDAPANAELVAQAIPLVRERCNMCHLGSLTPSDTEGVTRDAPSLDGWGSREWIYEQMVNPQRIEQYSSRNHMPRFRDKLGDRELRMIVDFTRQLRSRTAPSVQRPPAPTPAPAAVPAAPGA
jgi:ubiquinol-cytochrome c reductase cytochrome b subunit